MPDINQYKRDDCTILANTSSSKYEVVDQCLRNLGFLVSNDPQVGEKPLPHLIWMDTGVTNRTLAMLKPWQKVNHFPEMTEICRKDSLSRNLNKMRLVHPDNYDFFPRTYRYPADFHRRPSNSSIDYEQTFIAKPDASSEGKGVFLFQHSNCRAVRNRFNSSLTDLVVQEYIHDPYLIDGLKFDLRIYVTVLSASPLRAVIFHDGLVRFATQKYQVPNSSNMDNKFIHLTNYAINKHASEYQTSGSSKSKRSLSSVLQYISTHHGKLARDNLWSKIKEAIANTLTVAQPSLAASYLKCSPLSNISGVQNRNDGDFSQCFEILGFDVLIDQKLKPWIIEVNHAPSFSCAETIDHLVKRVVITESVNLACGSIREWLLFTQSISKACKQSSYERLLSQPNVENRTFDLPKLALYSPEHPKFEYLEFNDELLQCASSLYEQRHKPTKSITARLDFIKERQLKIEYERKAYEDWRKRCAEKTKGSRVYATSVETIPRTPRIHQFTRKSQTSNRELYRLSCVTIQPFDGF
eukprot:Partr_v1_DN26967_c0_g1_i2_m7155 putative Tubulin tyrosine ligase-like family, member